ncbi:hypothetical protein DMN91_010258 [Ooceraea biroi]|uniref:Uncharacterized protein n=1 Tax=Ooceraea biroi TaxID=2015173 RepID=A0A3L8DBZ0_OOCBI|nr:hypothetical protein DMN91_010258 [Ooceraea biroi]
MRCCDRRDCHLDNATLFEQRDATHRGLSVGGEGGYGGGPCEPATGLVAEDTSRILIPGITNNLTAGVDCTAIDTA